MKRARSIIPVLGLLSILLVAAGPARGEIKAGEGLPDISGRNLVGENISLKDCYRKTPLVVAFWSIYCKPCVAEISSLIKLQERYKGKICVIGIATDGELPPARIRTFIDRYEQFEKKKINYQVIFDEHNAITKQLGVGFLPTVLAVDTDGKVINTFVGFDEKDEADIFAGIEKMLPIAAPAVPAEYGSTVFEVESRVPACGFYDENGWRESFYGNKDLGKEMERVAAAAREVALKMGLNMALETMGINLYEKAMNAECIQPYGVFLQESPWKERDSLTNLLNAINFRRYTQVVESSERWLGNAYYVRQRISVNLSQLRDELERLSLSLKPISVTFAVINMGKVERMLFQEAILAQSKFIGRIDFPAFTVYAGQDTFIAELEKMDFGGMRVFVNDAGSGVVEAEVWR